MVAGGWRVEFGGVEVLEVGSASDSNEGEHKVAGKGGCLSMGGGRWVDWIEGGGVEVWELVNDGEDEKKKKGRGRKVLTRLEVVKGLKGVEVLEGGGLVVRGEVSSCVFDATRKKGNEKRRRS